MNELLGTHLIRLIARGQTVIGRYGRRGFISGVLQEHELIATLRDDLHKGSLTATFDEDFESFDGVYVSAQSDQGLSLRCSGTRVTRKRSQPPSTTGTV
jgi:hypothetical protein